MFSQIFGLFLTLLLVNFISFDSHASGLGTPLEANIWAIFGYGLLLLLIAWQGKFFSKESQLFFVQGELLLFIGFCFFGLGVQRWFVELPLSRSVISFIAFISYSNGLLVYHYFATSSLRKALQSLRLLLPLVLPLLVFTFLTDLFYFWSQISTIFGGENGDSIWENVAFSLFTVILVGVCLVSLPPLLVRLWKCTPLTNVSLCQQLDLLCEKAAFCHGGFKVWHAMGDMPNAAILGILPVWRYILLTPSLLQELSPTSVKAILAHEIGHSKYYHLLLYPCILLGMAVSGALLVEKLAPFLEEWLSYASHLYPSYWWPFAFQPLLFAFFAAAVALYFRFVFGYFSRLFERQADLYGMTIGIPAIQMIGALDDIAYACGGTHDLPSWHHYGLGERIRFLHGADANTPRRHGRRVVWSLILYAFALIGAIILLF